MKNLQHISPNSQGYQRINRTHEYKKEPKPAPTGSLTGLFPVVLDGGKTIIYISDKSKENEIRQKYAKER